MYVSCGGHGTNVLGVLYFGSSLHLHRDPDKIVDDNLMTHRALVGILPRLETESFSNPCILQINIAVIVQKILVSIA